MKETTVLAFDSEDDGRGKPFLWCFTWDKGSTYFRKQHDAIAFVERFSASEKAEGRRLEVWATNLEYDLVNLFPADRLAEITFRFGRSHLCGATWKGAHFRDTVRHLPASVAELGGLVGLEKREKDLFSRDDRSFAAFLSRCQSDATITYRAARHFRDVYGEFGLAPKMTLASTALAIWKEGYWKKEIFRPRSEVWDLALDAYHGGRTEAFAGGEYDDVEAVDAASMFPWAMTSGPLPLPWGLYSRVGPGAAVEPFGIYDVDVESDLVLPRLPFRSADGTIYPNGRWRARYVGEELLAFARAGGRFRVRRGIVLRQSCDPFQSYVSDMFARKQSARGLDRSLYKLLLNGLYGKFGQKGRLVRAAPVSRFAKMEPRPSDARIWNGLAIWNTETSPPPWSNQVWPAFVTARARVKLADEMERVKKNGGRVLYCDTDSIFFSGGSARFPARARSIGQFERRGRFSKMLLVGKKEYALKTGPTSWECHAKGVPSAERFRYLTEGEATFQRPTRLRESARVSVPANVWKDVSKKRRTFLRANGPDGAIPSPILGDGQSRDDGS